MNKSSKTRSPARRIIVGYKTIRSLTERLHDAVLQIDDLIENDKESITMFEVVKGKPVVEAIGPDGVMSSEDFFKNVDRIGEYGGVEYTPKEKREKEIWAQAFAKAAKKLEEELRRIREHPSKL